MKTVTVRTALPYEVHVGSGLIDRAGELIAAAAVGRRCCLVMDNAVADLYGERVRTSLENAGFTVHSLTIPSGESAKTLSVCGDLLSFFARAGLTRTDFAVALGGGMTGDLTGFSAAIYQRGISFVQIPTTLLAACDASVGGKTAIDLPEGKNLAGAFHQPALVICDTDTFRTLPFSVFNDGMSEVVKHALIADRTLLDLLMNHDAAAHIDTVVERSVAIKAAIVAEDEREHGRRRILNFGHTLGHAIEKLSGYTVSHGSAVSIGMTLAARAGERLGISPSGTLDTVLAAAKRCSLPTHCPYGADALLSAAIMDKKRSGNGIDIVILREIGAADTIRLTMEELRRFTEAAIWT